MVYDNLPRASVPLVPHAPSTPTVIRTYTQSTQFYPNMRFQSPNITYSVESVCDASKRRNIADTLAILENSTVLRFNERVGGEITILCSGLPPEPIDTRHFVAGEGGPSEILNNSRYAVIRAGTISLYREERCTWPHIALHEMFHVLGFDHNTNPASVLYPTLDCAQTIDSYLTDEINQLYRDPSEPDLRIVTANGTQSGKYVSFNVEIENAGLVDVPATSLRVYADNTLIKDFDMDSVPLNAHKILTVTNLNVGRGVRVLTLEIDGTHAIRELDETNNKIDLTLTS